NNMNQGANPSANSANMNQGANPSGMTQNFGPGMQRMRQWITWMNQLNQAYWQMMLQMYMQNLQMMGQFCQMVQNTMPKTGADGNQEPAQDSPAVPAPESAEA
ncbi:MAG: hypothetical protein Q4F43_09115, partial [Eubacteriales bacterium]|nr:hypothetical protein [Eubacteriales bacterium]